MLVQFFTNQEIEAATRELKDARVIPGMMSESAALSRVSQTVWNFGPRPSASHIRC